jgi:hypothetical protein
MATPPDFTTGQVLTAAQMNAVGLWLVKTQTVTGGNAATVVTNAFNTDFQNYKIIVSNGATSSGNTSLNLTFGATVANYDYAGFFFGPSGTGVFGGINQTNVLIGEGTTNLIQCNFECQNPFLAKHTTFANMTAYNLTNNNGRLCSGALSNTTSYTDFTLTLTGGATFTSGTIYVYGYRD